MSELNSNLGNIKICSVCGIRCVDNVFYFYNNNTPAHPDKVYTRVCRHIKDNPEKLENCINKQGNTDLDLDYAVHNKSIEYDMNRLLN